MAFSLGRRIALLGIAVFFCGATSVWSQWDVTTFNGSSVDARNDFITSIPSTFTGIDINTFVGADRFYNAGITGQNASVANVEAGHVWSGHETLGHVSQFVAGTDAWGASTAERFDFHATWAGHVLGGRNGGGVQGIWQPGIASGADLRSGAIASQWTGNAPSTSFQIGIDAFTNSYDTYFGAVDVINSSWGFTGGDANRGENSLQVAMDALAEDRPSTTFVASAGNSGPGVNTVGGAGAGYNAITVGSLNNGGDNSYGSVTPSSSRGPQDYGDPVNGTIAGVRAAVDISAPGTDLTLAFFGGQAGGNNPTLTDSMDFGAGNNSYAPGVGGTSFAAPTVAGGATLLASYEKTLGASAPEATDARVIKAVLLNSADKIIGWDNGQGPVGLGVIETTQSLDYTSGAGALNLDQAFDQYTGGIRDVLGTGTGGLGVVDNVGWDFGLVNTLTENQYFLEQQVEENTVINVTLTWFRERFFDPGTLIFSDDRQADLDLFVFLATGDGITRLDDVARSVSDYNTVEHLSFLAPETGFYGIGVQYVGDTFSLIGPGVGQNYGLAWFTIPVPEPASGVLVAMTMLVVLRRSRRHVRAA